MANQHFISRDHSPAASYYLPADDDADDTGAWADYCAEAAQVDRAHVFDCVLSSLDADDSPLYTLIDSCLKDHQEPGRARESLTVLAALGQAILDRVAASVDDQVNLRLAIGGRAA